MFLLMYTIILENDVIKENQTKTNIYEKNNVILHDNTVVLRAGRLYKRQE